MATAKTKAATPVSLNGKTLGTPQSAALQQVLTQKTGSGPFATSALTGLDAGANMTRPPSAVVGNGPWTPLATTQVAGVPQSFVDEVVQQLNTGGGVQFEGKQRFQPNQVNEQTLQYAVQQAWAQLSVQEQQRYQAGDAKKITTANNQATINNVANAGLQIPGEEAKAINSFYGQNIMPAVQNIPATQAAAAAANRTAEGQVAGLTNDYKNTVQGNQAARMSDIQSTNAGSTNLVNYLAGQAQGTNTANTGLYKTYAGELNNANAVQAGLYGNLASANQQANQFQTGLYNTYAGQAAATNANQTGIYNTFAGQNAASNAQQSALYSTLAGQNSASNAQQNAIVAQFTAQLSQLNGEDRANYMNYLRETNPYMAELVAQNSDPELVGNQKDVLQRYKELSTPQVSAAERLIASQARQKFESDDRASREALMQQLAGRGLKSGGLVIANNQANRQQLSQDRMNAELGLQANAVSRGMEGLAGYGQEANILRNADDAVKQFQDQYKQNEAQRISQLALNRNQSGYQMTNAQTGRAQAGYNAQTETVQNNSARNQSTYNAGTQTTQDNAYRNQLTYNAGTETNNNNDARNMNVFNAGTTTQNNNSLRDQGTYNAGTQSQGIITGNNTLKFATGQQTNTDNFNRTSGVVDTGIKVLGDNSTRVQTGLTAGDTTAANMLNTGAASAMYPTQNRQTEAQNAITGAQTASGIGTNFANVQQGISSDKSKALEDYLRRMGLGAATGTASMT